MIIFYLFELFYNMIKKENEPAVGHNNRSRENNYI